MLAVLDYIESLEGPSQDMNRWAEDARDVVCSAEDMINSFMISTAKRSRAKVLKCFALFFNHMFLRFKLSPKVKRLMLRINDLSKEKLDEREIVWLEWVREICLPAKDFLTSFVSKREQKIKRCAKLKAPTFIGADSELRKKMKVIRSRIQYAYGRRWIYGMVESDEIKELQPSKAFELESVWRDLRLMSTLVKDVQGMKDKGERVKVWLGQMGDLAFEIDALNTQIQGHQEKMKGGLGGELRVLSSTAEKIERISNDDNNLEEAETGSSQQHTMTGRYVREIEVTESSLTKASIDIGPSTSETVEKPHATDSTDIPPTSSLQKDKKRDRAS
nr:hypothetical protein CFP56_73995 [Quercus suber]